MNGWLIVNGFLQSSKFDDLYRLLAEAFQAQGATLTVFPNTAFATPLTPLMALKPLRPLKPLEPLRPLKPLKSLEPLRPLKPLKPLMPLKPLEPLRPLKSLKPDFVLFWDKDVALAQRLEAAGLPVFNSATAIATCDDKIKTALALARQGVVLPRTIFAPKTFEGVGYASLDFLRSAADELGLPLVIKEAYGSFGQQVYLAQTQAEAEDIVRRIGHKDFLMQEFIATSRGTDLRVNVVGGEVVAAMRRFSATDFRSNVTLGGGMERATPTPAQCEIAVAACRAVGADFAGVDILYGPNDAPLVCEVNSNPHFRSTLDCTGVNLADVLAAHVLRAIAP